MIREWTETVGTCLGAAGTVYVAYVAVSQPRRDRRDQNLAGLANARNLAFATQRIAAKFAQEAADGAYVDQINIDHIRGCAAISSRIDWRSFAPEPDAYPLIEVLLTIEDVIRDIRPGLEKDLERQNRLKVAADKSDVALRALDGFLLSRGAIFVKDMATVPDQGTVHRRFIRLVLGKNAGDDPQRRPGNWMFGGAVWALLLTDQHLHWWLIILIMLVTGGFANWREDKQIERRSTLAANGT